MWAVVTSRGPAPCPTSTSSTGACSPRKWRFISGLGWLYVTIEDISGGQWIGRVGCEYLLGERWAFGGAFNLATIDVDWKGLEDANGDKHLNGAIDMDIFDFSIFARVRF